MAIHRTSVSRTPCVDARPQVRSQRVDETRVRDRQAQQLAAPRRRPRRQDDAIILRKALLEKENKLPINDRPG
jgi:hypothetical protein